MSTVNGYGNLKVKRIEFADQLISHGTADDDSELTLAFANQGADRTITTPSAADLVSHLVDCSTNLGFTYIVRNEATGGGSKTLNMVGGTGCSVIGGASIPKDKIRHYMVHITNVGSGTEAYDLISITDDFPHS